MCPGALCWKAADLHAIRKPDFFPESIDFVLLAFGSCAQSLKRRGTPEFDVYLTAAAMSAAVCKVVPI